jgi:hypothetical protein
VVQAPRIFGVEWLLAERGIRAYQPDPATVERIVDEIVAQK